MRTTLGHRLSAYAAISALAVSGALLVGSPASAVPDPVGVADGAAWLADQPVDGLLPGPFGGGDVGVTIDAGMSLAAVGGHAGVVSEIADAVQQTQQAKDYLEYEGVFDYDQDGADDVYVSRSANATAKALAFLQELSPARGTAAGIDLRERLEALTTDSGSSAGRIADVTTLDGEVIGDDFANSLGQAFAVRALTAAGSSEAAAATSFLLRQQCPGGDFRLGMGTRGGADQDCSAPFEDTDVTAIVLQQLVALDAPSPAVSRALAAGQAWLLSQQRTDGSWGGAGPTAAPNANSTGLALLALEGRTCTPATPYLRGLQVPQGAPAPLADEVGALAYQQEALIAARADGIGSNVRDQWQRVAAQAVPALAYLAQDATGAAPTLSSPQAYQRAGSAVALTVGDLVAGETLCVTGPGTQQRATATGTSLTSRVVLPGGTGNRAYRVVTGDGDTATTTVRVLGPRQLTVRVNKARVKRSGPLTTTVRGLAAGEKLVVRFKGAVVRKGVASPVGIYRTSFRAGRQVGPKRVVVVGEFPAIRSGRDTVRVVR